MSNHHDNPLTQTIERDARVQAVKELTSLLLHKYYCENDVASTIEVFDDRLTWIGAGEEEYAVGTEAVSGVFRKFADMIPKCSISDEEYDVMELSPDVSLCSGRMWIATDTSTDRCLRIHQRVTVVYRWVGGRPRCCHIHSSNPYSERTQQDVGFPAQMGQHTYEYLQEYITEQEKQIEAQTEILRRMSFEDSLTGLFNRNKFNQIIQDYKKHPLSRLGVACIDLNGLKKINDQMGHSAGDSLIRRTADHIARILAGKGYRIGGDEFVVIDTELEEDAFRKAVAAVNENMMQDGISVSVGLSWRRNHCNIKEQFDEADRQMYQSKAAYYSSHETDRRYS